MLRVRTSLLVLSIGLVSFNTAQAGWHEFWDRFDLDFHRNNCWDEPFTSIDRRAARAPFAAMVHSGWRTQNTLGRHYFNPETNVLNGAGERKLHLIVTSSPEPFRTVYVTGSHEPGVADRRVDSVQQTLVKLLPDESLPAVIPAIGEPRGWPAEYIDTIGRKVIKSVPNPRLPSFQAAGGVGG